MSSALPRIIGFVTSKVNKINRLRPSHEVEGAEENKQGRTKDHRNKVESKMVPKVTEVLKGEGGYLGNNDSKKGRKKEVHAMGDEVVIAKLDILKLN